VNYIKCQQKKDLALRLRCLYHSIQIERRSVGYAFSPELRPAFVPALLLAKLAECIIDGAGGCPSAARAAVTSRRSPEARRRKAARQGMWDGGNFKAESNYSRLLLSKPMLVQRLTTEPISLFHLSILEFGLYSSLGGSGR